MNGHKPNVAIVHDWLVGGGAEKVVLELHKLYPEAPIYTSYCTPEWRQKLDDKVVTGWLQHLGAVRKFIPPLRILWFTRLDLSSYDLVISSSGNGEAKSVKTPDSTLHISYIHAPTHFYWRHYHQYLNNPGFGLFNPLARFGLRLLVGPLRKWDLQAAKRPDYLIANSTHTQSEIKEFYGRESIVIHPPVDIARFTHAASQTPRKGFVTAGRQTPYKRTDLLVAACTELGLPLTVIGRGPEHENLKNIAGPTITFRTDVSDEELPKLLGLAEAFLFAAYEDFGITPVEAMAAGTPVIAYGAGGALDYVVPGRTGEFFAEQTVESLVNSLKTFDSSAYDTQKIQEFAHKFSETSFQEKTSEYIKSRL